MSLCNREASVCKLLCKSLLLPQTWLDCQLAHDGPHMGLHPGCAQGQGQRSRTQNVCYTVRSHVLSLHALTLWNTFILSFQYKYQAARCLNIGMSYSVIDGLVSFCNRVHNGCSGSSKVIDFGTNRKGVCDFLLVINSNFGPILHRFCDTVTENCEFFLPHSHLTPSLEVNPFKFLDELFIAKRRVLGLSIGEDFVILACTVLTQIQCVKNPGLSSSSLFLM